MELTGKNIIGNALSAEGTEVLFGENPALGKKLGQAFYEATTNEVGTAVTKANDAFQAYRFKSGAEKAILLDAIADEIAALGETLIQRCVEETGLPEARITGERGRTINQLKLFSSLLRDGSWVDARIDLAEPERKPLPRPDIRSMLKPLGPVGIFGASNFPLAFSVAGGDTASALAAGCTVVFKAHPAHPGTCELVGRAIQQAVTKTGMPEGTFSMVHGKSNAVGLALVKHPLIQAIGFTGSYAGGKALFDEANKRAIPIPVYAEMGSTNPVFILPDALKQRMDTIAKDLATSVTAGTGQFCTNPGLVVLQESDDQKKFNDALAASIQSQEPGTMLTSTILNTFRKNLDRLRTVSGVSILGQGKQNSGNGYKATAHVLATKATNFLEDHLLEEEVFGPSTLAITASTREEFIQVARKMHGHLTATVHATEKDLTEYSDLILELEQKVGRIIINGYPTGVEVAHAMVHGGPFPATTDSRSTSVGTGAILRFARPVCYQNFPEALLSAELHNGNPLKISRTVNGIRVNS